MYPFRRSKRQCWIAEPFLFCHPTWPLYRCRFASTGIGCKPIHTQASVKRQVGEETRDRRFTLHTKVNKMPVMQDVMVRQDGKFVAIFAMTNIKFPKN